MTQTDSIQLQLEDLAYQQVAIDTAVKIFEGQCFNASNQPSLMGVNANICHLNDAQIQKNKIEILKNNNTDKEQAQLEDARQACIEIETGTGKTLVYIRTIYELTGQSLDIGFAKHIETALATEPTPNKGIYDFSICDADSNPEHNFAYNAGVDPQVLCFLKLPNNYKVNTPIGSYNPDFGIIVQNKGLKDKSTEDYWFVIETKSTNDLEDGTLREEEEYTRIKYGINTLNYIAPIKDYEDGFKQRAKKAMSQQ